MFDSINPRYDAALNALVPVIAAYVQKHGGETTVNHNRIVEFLREQAVPFGALDPLLFQLYNLSNNHTQGRFTNEQYDRFWTLVTQFSQDAIDLLNPPHQDFPMHGAPNYGPCRPGQHSYGSQHRYGSSSGHDPADSEHRYAEGSPKQRNGDEPPASRPSMEVIASLPAYFATLGHYVKSHQSEDPSFADYAYKTSVRYPHGTPTQLDTRNQSMDLAWEYYVLVMDIIRMTSIACQHQCEAFRFADEHTKPYLDAFRVFVRRCHNRGLDYPERIIQLLDELGGRLSRNEDIDKLFIATLYAVQEPKNCRVELLNKNKFILEACLKALDALQKVGFLFIDREEKLLLKAFGFVGKVSM